MRNDVKTDGDGLGSDPSVLNFKQVLLEIVTLILIAIAVPLLVYLDIVVFFGALSEFSLTELSQLMLLGVSAAAFASGAKRQPHQAGYLWAMALFCLLMCIRESDGWLDGIVHGFWIYPALVCIVVGAAVIWRNSAVCKTGFLRHFSTRNGTLVFFGLFVVIFFSRLFGTGEIWRPILADGYNQTAKSAIQEGLELFGYAVFAFGAIGSWKNGFR